MKILEVIGSVVSVDKLRSGAAKHRGTVDLVKSIQSGAAAVSTEDSGKVYKAEKKLTANDLAKGMVVLGAYNSTNQGADVYEIIGITDNDQKYGAGGVKFDSMKELLAAKGVKGTQELWHHQQESKKEYGHHFYLTVKDLNDGDVGSWFYLDDRGRWCRGSGAEPLTFTKLKETAEKLDEIKLIRANRLTLDKNKVALDVDKKVTKKRDDVANAQKKNKAVITKSIVE